MTARGAAGRRGALPFFDMDGLPAAAGLSPREQECCRGVGAL
uniref:Truncated macrophage colony stimulating factor n=1 Tax=Rattus norvegicus TaxID=10116 RepID=Q8K408_RAT|nr:truncated macrophage colony stimulating factor [Rattus norvegicus]